VSASSSSLLEVGEKVNQEAGAAPSTKKETVTVSPSASVNGATMYAALKN
jgi:hypothetical protein